MHHELEGFVPPRDASPRFRRCVRATGARRRVACARTLDDLVSRSNAGLPADAVEPARELLVQVEPILDRIASLERDLAPVDLPRVVVHGDYGLHNLLFPSPGQAVVVDFESARLDWRVNDLVSALGKYRRRDRQHDTQAMETFLRAYVAAVPAHRRRARVPRRGLGALSPSRRSAVLELVLRDRGAAAQALVGGGCRAPGGVGGRPTGPDRTPGADRRRAPGMGASIVNTRPALTIMLLTPNLDVGGAQETARNLAKYLPRAGHRVVVCTFADGSLRQEIEDLGVPVVVLPARRHSVVDFPRFCADVVRRGGPWSTSSIAVGSTSCCRRRPTPRSACSRSRSAFVDTCRSGGRSRTRCSSSAETS